MGQLHSLAQRERANPDENNRLALSNNSPQHRGVIARQLRNQNSARLSLPRGFSRLRTRVTRVFNPTTFSVVSASPLSPGHEPSHIGLGATSDLQRGNTLIHAAQSNEVPSQPDREEHPIHPIADGSLSEIPASNSSSVEPPQDSHQAEFRSDGLSDSRSLEGQSSGPDTAETAELSTATQPVASTAAPAPLSHDSQGTVVLVQGVVHTTDSHANGSAVNTMPRTTHSSPRLLEDPVRPETGSVRRPDIPIPESRTQPANPNEASDPLQPSRLDLQAALTMSSIDILSSLLSAAAAATASSLMPASGAPSTSIVSPPVPSSSSPPINVPSLEPRTAENVPHLEDPTSSASRLRNAWDSFRDRVVGPRVRSDELDTFLPTDPSTTSIPEANQSSPSPHSYLNSPEARQHLVDDLRRLLGEGTPRANNDSLNPPLPRSTLATNPFDRFLSDIRLEVRLALLQLYAQRRQMDLSAADGIASGVEAIRNLQRPVTHSNSTTATGQNRLSRVVSVDESVRGNGNGLDGRGGITWWRSFRFPAVHRGETDPRTSSAVGEQDVRVADGNPSPVSDPSANPEQQDRLIPVIVVGLQSVGSRLGDEAANRSPTTETPATAPVNASNVTTHSSAAGLGSRGSDLLPGLRDFIERERTQNGSRDAPADHTIDGQTYMIFVVGGYYPSSHALVTGTDTMESFELLWQLSELLGQVKPAVATKEDIAKAGLRTVKCDELGQLHAEDQVAENTLERCLICLEDYQPSEDLRLLKCRHAFHLSCVDKWLQEGRNNCPACRSEGVPVDGQTA